MSSDANQTAEWDLVNSAMNRRLLAIATCFFKALEFGESDVELSQIDKWLPAVPKMPWGRELDFGLLDYLVNNWLQAVNRQMFQKRIRKARPGDMPRLLTEEVVAMRPLTEEERESVWNEFADAGVMAPVRLRLINLINFHIHLFAPSRASGRETFQLFIKRQEKEAKRQFPKALREDYRLLSLFPLWYMGTLKEYAARRATDATGEVLYMDEEESLKMLKDIAGQCDID